MCIIRLEDEVTSRCCKLGKQAYHRIDNLYGKSRFDLWIYGLARLDRRLIISGRLSM